MIRSSGLNRKAGTRPKISETFLQFAGPILINMPAGVSAAEIEEVLKVPWTAWNATVFDEITGTNEQVTKIRNLASHDPSTVQLMEQLIERKRELFATHTVLIGQYRVTLKDGYLNLWAEARDPHSAIKNSARRKPENQ